MWPNRRLLELLGIEVPIVQAPMAGANGAEMAIAVCEAGGLGSLPCAMLNPAKAEAEAEMIRQRTRRPFNMNFFCHAAAEPDAAGQARWVARLAPFYAEYGLVADGSKVPGGRTPFDEDMCAVVEQQRPAVVSFHFGLPSADLLARVKQCGAVVLSSATTVAEAVWLQDHGCDAIIAQGCEAGGHRGMFLATDVSMQPGTMALVPQLVDAVNVPVIAAGGIGDGRGIAAAFALGAAGVQMGTAYLLTPQALIADLHRAALQTASAEQTALTNVFSGKPARGVMNRVMREVGPMSDQVPVFPSAGAALAPLKAKAEAAGQADFSSLWSGQAASLCQAVDAGELTRQLAAAAQARLDALQAG